MMNSACKIPPATEAGMISRRVLEVPRVIQKEHKYCMEIYYKLKGMFPNIDADYIKQICPPDWAEDREAQLLNLVEHLLAGYETVPEMVAETPKDYENNFDNYRIFNIIERLIGVFPDADPDYMCAIAQKNLDDPDGLNAFIEMNLERRDYPTRNEYKVRCNIIEQKRRYTTHFNVEDFLSIISDPHAHFSDINRKNKNQPYAFEFLKARFNSLDVCLLRVHCLIGK